MSRPDCALLVAVPLDRDEFIADLTAGTDFLMQFTAQQRTRDDETLWRLYNATATVVRFTIMAVARRGVTVLKRSTAGDFSRCLLTHQVVTLVAHWRTARFRAGEILDPSVVQRWLRGGTGDGTTEAHGTAEAVALALNERLAPPTTPVALDDVSGAAMETQRQYQMWMVRQEIEQLLGPAVRPGGPAVEFSDGLIGVDQLTAAVPAGYTGVIDLTICNSALLAEETRRRHRQGLIIANAFPATLSTRMNFYRLAIDRMVRNGMPYQDAVFLVRRDIRRMR